MRKCLPFVLWSPESIPSNDRELEMARDASSVHPYKIRISPLDARRHQDVGRKLRHRRARSTSDLVASVSLAAVVVVAAVTESLAAAPPSCERPAPGSVVSEPADLYSVRGLLNVTLNYMTSIDADNRTLFCFRTPSGLESPTLHVKPGDTLRITLNNMVPPLPTSTPTEELSVSGECGATLLTGTSVNMHLHGANVSPACHGDQVIHTLVNSGQSFSYNFKFPNDEPPGLYWYHSHVHGLAEAATQAGATGLIVVDGIENLQPSLARLPARVLTIRDQVVAGNPTPGGAVPSWDVSLNYVPISYPAMTPAVIDVRPGQTELWRVANTSADSIMD